MKKGNKEESYKMIIKQANSLLDGITDEIALMSSIASITYQEFNYYYWAGFYRVVEQDKLLIGPYQGTPGCLSINFGRGVCGVCAQNKKTLIVPDVHKFSGHIACDSRSNSEIVVPVFDKNNNLIAVFDVDSTEFEAFDEIDKYYLEELMEIFKNQ